MVKNTASVAFVYTMVCLMIITGSINTISNKLQNNAQSLGLPYHHVWFIVFCMFLGESICLFYYYGLRKENEDESQLPEAPALHLAIPAVCDLIANTLMTFGLSILAGSVYQMFRGSLIFFTAFFAVLFLKQPLYRFHYLGLGSTIIGLVLVGLATISGKHDSGETNSVLGIVLIICGQLFVATQYVVEETYMKAYKCHPLRAIGWEGIWGGFIYFICLLIFQWIPCSPPATQHAFSALFCSVNSEGVWTLENATFALYQILMSGELLFLVLLYIFSIGIYNFVGISVTKYASSTSRAVADSSRTVVVWGFFLLPFNNPQNQEHFHVLQLIGFILLIFGTLVYYQIIVLPCFGFDANGDIQVEKEDLMEKEVQISSKDSESTSDSIEIPHSEEEKPFLRVI